MRHAQDLMMKTLDSFGGKHPGSLSTAPWVSPVQERLRSRREAADPLSISLSPRPSPSPVHMARLSVWSAAEPLLLVLESLELRRKVHESNQFSSKTDLNQTTLELLSIMSKVAQG